MIFNKRRTDLIIKNFTGYKGQEVLIGNNKFSNFEFKLVPSKSVNICNEIGVLGLEIDNSTLLTVKAFDFNNPFERLQNVKVQFSNEEVISNVTYVDSKYALIEFIGGHHMFLY
jgi:hypothetical protein